MLCWDEAFCESEIARKEALHYTEQLPGLREGEVASEKIDSPEQRCRQKHGKARPPIPRSFLRDVSFRGGSCQKSGGFHQLEKRVREEGASTRKSWRR